MAGYNVLNMHNPADFLAPKTDNFRISLRLARLSASYDKRFFYYYYDMFGFFDDYNRLSLPKIDKTELLDACLERARELEGCNFMFSGGVDSTFLLAVFKAAGVNVKVYHYCPQGIFLRPKLRKYVERNFEVHYLKNPLEVQDLGHIYMGTLSDAFFFSNHRIIGERDSTRIKLKDGRDSFILNFRKVPFIPLQDRMWRMRMFNYDEIELCLAYAALLGVPLDTNNHVARFIDWASCMPKHLCQSPWDYFVGQDSFFNTQKFADIAFTQYWDSNDFCPHNKKLYRDFMCDVFGSDFGVEKNYN